MVDWEEERLGKDADAREKVFIKERKDYFKQDISLSKANPNFNSSKLFLLLKILLCLPILFSLERLVYWEKFDPLIWKKK